MEAGEEVDIMDDQLCERLAIAYAQAKLQKEQAAEGYDGDQLDEELHFFLKAYRYASANLQQIWKDMD